MLNGYGQQQYDQYGLPTLNSLVKKKNNYYGGYTYDTGNATANTTPEEKNISQIDTSVKLDTNNNDSSFFGGGLGSISDGLGNLFKPSGESGVSMFSSTMDGISKGLGAINSFAAMSLAKDKAKLEKEAFELEKAKQARLDRAYDEQEARNELFAKNAGNGAVYKV